MTWNEFKRWADKYEDDIVELYIKHNEDLLSKKFYGDGELCKTDDSDEFDRWLTTLTIDDVSVEFIAFCWGMKDSQMMNVGEDGFKQNK